MPFEEFIDWKQFAIFVPESDARSAMLRLPHIPTEEIRRRRLALGCVRQHFVYHADGVVKPLDAVDTIMAALSSRDRAIRGFARWLRSTHP